MLLGVSAQTAFVLYLAKQSEATLQADRREKSEYYLDGVVMSLMQKLSIDDSFGTHGEELRLEHLAEHSEQCYGLISFKGGSRNNLAGDEAVRLGERSLPEHSVYVVAEAHFDGVELRQELILAKPPFPYALASSGPLKTQGAFLLGSVNDETDLGEPDFEKKLRPSSLASNSKGNPAIELIGSPVHITGHVLAPGKIVAPGAKIDGQLQENHRPVALPDIQLGEYDPKDRPVVVNLDDTYHGEILKGFCRRSGSFRSEKPLKLEAGILYIDGDFDCNGPIEGVGALVVTGNARIKSLDLSALRKLAVVCGGNLEITGGGKESTRLRGLLYAKGNLSLARVTVVGAVIAGGSNDRELKLDNVNVLGSKDGVQFNFEVGFSVPTQVTIPGDTFAGVPDRTLRLRQRKDPKSGEMRATRPSDFLGADGKSVLIQQAGQWTIPSNLLDDYFEFVDANTGLEVSPKKDLQNLVTSNRHAQLLSTKLANAASEALESSNTVVSKGSLNLDLNRFLRLSDQLKIVYRTAN